MKNFLVTLVLVFSISANAQSYTVIHSIGKIYNNTTGSCLEKGSRVDESAKLIFKSAGARAAVLSSSRGRFILHEKSNSASQSDLAYTLSSVISPVRGRLSTRAGGINNAIDFKKHFEEGPVALTYPGYKVAVSPNAYPMNESKFFYVQYTYNGERINKKLDSNDGYLLFNTASLFSVDGQTIASEKTSDSQLFYFDTSKQESTLITELDFIVVSDEELRSLASSLKEIPQEEQKSALLEIINELYGKCEASYVEKFLESE